ncbi:hypothetical protein M378DRAFT_170545 [Amanita muscaria Koide BX008]|uniref:Uncharacterized protein n=1 Tax=Amanita muscaria (strain Koide BX008) TaxID=946122 RepID=A0A0C2WP44_AMAMK|nr:hypothetical protein M378DRAFT_170545 [Amanita muscaria Koide BX008]
MRPSNAILECLVKGKAMMKYAYEEATQVVADVWGVVKRHPWLCTAVVLGITAVVLGPGVLGFGKLGPTKGTIASWWQSTYAGFVPKGSLFSIFQRVGMRWWI